jgi:hypothetical protein
MEEFLNDEVRLQAESLPFLLPHAKKIDDLTKAKLAVSRKYDVCETKGPYSAKG